MTIRRPTPELIRARQWEIKRRYSQHLKVGKRTRSMSAIRLAELGRWLDDTFGAGVELEPSDHSAMIARIFVHHFIGLSNGQRRASEWLTRYCSTMIPRDRERLISEADHWPLKWSADKLAWKLRVNDEQRTRLKLTTIGAIDVSREQRAQRRKAKQAELQRTLRAKRKADRVNTI